MAQSKFQTIVEIPEFPAKIGYSKKSMFLGSCFTENIGSKLSNLKYPVDVNPFGILYNPFSVANGLELLLQNKTFSEKDLVQQNGLWHSFSHHGKFSSPNKTTTLKQINDRIQSSAAFLKTSNFLFITFGTAWVYKLKENNSIVSNCHKIPAKEFYREKLLPQEIVEKYKALLKFLWEENSNLKIVFTVSPIRHWKDGAIENQRSKATLLLAIDRIIQEFGENKCSYFPSYEIVMDELRDYRFYAEDMLHLSEVAVNHIWDKFESHLINEESQRISKEVLKIVNAVNHRPLNRTSKAFQSFIKNFLKKTNDLETRFPNLNFRLEKEYFKEQLNKIENK